jgi:hypothetical protein
VAAGAIGSLDADLALLADYISEAGQSTVCGDRNVEILRVPVPVVYVVNARAAPGVRGVEYQLSRLDPIVIRFQLFHVERDSFRLSLPKSVHVTLRFFVRMIDGIASGNLEYGHFVIKRQWHMLHGFVEADEREFHVMEGLFVPRSGNGLLLCHSKAGNKQKCNSTRHYQRR